MKKILIIFSFVFLLIACSKSEPKEEMKAEMVTSTVTEPEQVAGASYLPDFKEEIEDDLTDEAVEPEEEVIEAEEPAEPVSKAAPAPKKTYKPRAATTVKRSIPAPAEEEIIVAMDENLKEKIEKDEELTKEVATPDPVTEEAAEEESGAPMGLIAILALAAVGGAGYFITKNKKSSDESEE